MYVQRTITIRIADDFDLRATLAGFQAVQQRISAACFNQGTPLNALALHRAVYEDVKGTINSQMTCTAIRLVAAAYASAKANKKSAQRPFQFKRPSALFLVGERGRDARFTDDGALSIWTVARRKRIAYSVPDAFKQTLAQAVEIDSLTVIERDGRLLGRRQRNRTRTFCQQTAAKLVRWARADSVLVFERLTLPQTSKNLRVRKGTRRRLSQWQRRLMRSSVTNAAERRGLLVADVNPAYTSQDCSRCGLRGVRKRHSFTCPHCGHEAHADVNAALNIRHRYTALRRSGPLSAGPEALLSVEASEGKPSPEGDSR